MVTMQELINGSVGPQQSLEQIDFESAIEYLPGLLTCERRRAMMTELFSEFSDKQFFVSACLALLKNHEYPNSIRLPLIYAIGLPGERARANFEAIEFLVECIGQESCRLAALYALLCVGGSEGAIPTIKEILGGARQRVLVKILSLKVLQRIGANAYDAISDVEVLLTDSKSVVRSEAFATLAKLGRPAKAAANSMLNVLQKEADPVVRLHAIRAIISVCPNNKQYIDSVAQFSLTDEEKYELAAIAFLHNEMFLLDSIRRIFKVPKPLAGVTIDLIVHYVDPYNDEQTSELVNRIIDFLPSFRNKTRAHVICEMYESLGRLSRSTSRRTMQGGDFCKLGVELLSLAHAEVENASFNDQIRLVKIATRCITDPPWTINESHLIAEERIIAAELLCHLGKGRADRLESVVRAIDSSNSVHVRRSAAITVAKYLLEEDRNLSSDCRQRYADSVIGHLESECQEIQRGTVSPSAVRTCLSAVSRSNTRNCKRTTDILSHLATLHRHDISSASQNALTSLRKNGTIEGIENELRIEGDGINGSAEIRQLILRQAEEIRELTNAVHELLERVSSNAIPQTERPHAELGGILPSAHQKIISELRSDAGLTLGQIGDMIRLSPSQVSRIARGESQPSRAVVLLLEHLSEKMLDKK